MLTVQQFKDLIAAHVRSLTAAEFNDICHTAYDAVNDRMLTKEEHATAIQTDMEGGGSLESLLCSKFLGVIVVHAVGGDGRDDCVHVFYTESSNAMKCRCLPYGNGFSSGSMPFSVSAELLFGSGNPADHPNVLNFGGVVSEYDPSKCIHLLQSANHYEALTIDSVDINRPAFRSIRRNLDLSTETACV